MRGTILDFLTLLRERPELARDVARLAAQYDFRFGPSGEVSDRELEAAAGGTGTLGALFESLRTATSTLSTEQQSLLDRLGDRQDVGDALGDQLRSVNEGLL